MPTTMRDKALQNIDLVDKNHALESNLLEMQGQIAAFLAQNQMLQVRLALLDSSQLLPFLDNTRMMIAGHRDVLVLDAQGGAHLSAYPVEEASEEEKEEDNGLSLIRRGGNCQVGCNKTASVRSKSNLGYMGEVHYVNDTDVFGSMSTMSPLFMNKQTDQDSPFSAQGHHISVMRQGNGVFPISPYSLGDLITSARQMPAKPPLGDAMDVEAIHCLLLPQGSGISPEVWPPLYPYLLQNLCPHMMRMEGLSDTTKTLVRNQRYWQPHP
jgi:hypothetical protein